MMTLCAGLCYVQVKSTTTMTMYCTKPLTTLNPGWQLWLSFDGIKLLPQTAGPIQYQKGKPCSMLGCRSLISPLSSILWSIWQTWYFWRFPLIEWLNDHLASFGQCSKKDSFIHEINILGLDISSRMYNRFQLLPAPLTPGNPITYWEEGKLITSVQGVQKAPSLIIVESADKVPAAHIESKLITSGRRGRPRGCAPFEHCALVN